MKRKMIAFLVALCLLLTGLPGTPVKVTAAEAERESVSVEDSALAALPAYQPEGDSKILDYVHADVFAQGDHVARLHEEETLSSYAFLNRDGTKTVYYLDEVVKFEAADGQILEKDLTLRSEKGGYATTQNDVSLHLPVSPASGVRLSYNNKQVTLVPQGGSGTAATDGKAVRYDDYYGPGMDLVYTPTMDGVKEEIILSAYSGVNSFTFLLNTGGLNLYQSANRYFLAESKLSDSKIWLGALEIFDAAIQPGPGNVTVETVMPGQQYRITLTVEEDYLTDPNTVYPVTIDPTLTVSDNTHGAGAIEDAPIYEGYSTSNFGSYQYNRAGYAGTTYKKGRTVVRLKGMLNDAAYGQITSERINSVKFYMADATGTSGVTVRIHALNSNYSWTENGITWNTATGYDASSWASATPAGGAFGEFDITNLVKVWKGGLYRDGQGGFVMIGANEASVDKSLCSSEFATTSKRPYVVVNYNGWLNYPTLVMNRGGATKTLQFNQAEGAVTWTSSDPAVATVSDNGVVTPVQIGTTTITARDTAGNTDSCSVRVVLPTGIYTFKNTRSQLYMHTENAGISTGTNVVQSSKYSSGLNQKAQLWRVNHLGSGMYSIRPLHKLNMGLSQESGFANLLEIGDVDNLASVNDNAEWTIEYIAGAGYRLRHKGVTTEALKVYQNSTSVGAELITGSDAYSPYSCYWDIVAASSPTPEIILYDTETETKIETARKGVAIGSTKILSELGLSYAVCATDSISQVINWTSSNTSVATVNQLTGTITGNAAGTTTIKGKSTDFSDEISFTVVVSKIPISGYELAYEPASWNETIVFGSDTISVYTNCYAYMLNNQLDPYGDSFGCAYDYNTQSDGPLQQPGEFYNDYRGAESEITVSNNASSIINAVEKDFELYNLIFGTSLVFERMEDPTSLCPNGTYKVALALDPGNDYHWYRQNPDGSWSHKPGDTDVTNQDGSGIIIEDPETANRGRYVEFVAFFYVSPWNHLYNGDSTNTALINLLENTHIQHNAHASDVTDTVADLS